MKKEIKVADLDYPINLGETKTPNLEEWFCKCDVIQNMFESGKASVVEIKQDSGFVKRVVTSLSDEQKKLCRQSSLCGPLIEKMQTETYVYNLDDNEEDNIQAAFHDGSYLPYEGKHRACCAKNFLSPDCTICVKDITKYSRNCAIIIA